MPQFHAFRVSPPPLRIEPGSSVGPYVVLRKLAQGGLSAVFVAHDPALDRELVLKIVPEDALTPAARARLLREARALAAVEHPGVVRIYGARGIAREEPATWKA